MSEQDKIQSLREALKLSPQNPPLRLMLADALLSSGFAEDAEKEYREALALWPEDEGFKDGLCRVFFRLGKHDLALALIEEMAKKPGFSSSLRVLYARLLLKTGDLGLAKAQYVEALKQDKTLADEELGKDLQVTPPSRKGKVKKKPDQREPQLKEAVARMGGEEVAVAGQADVERPSISFKDVGGMDGLKEEISMKIIYPLTHPEVFKAYGQSTGGGILMYRAPGMRKTYLARATAGEINAKFLSIGIHEVLDMWMGQSERNLHEVFELARRNRPCVLFFDEVDALGAKRADAKLTGGWRMTINQFLSEMDGTEYSNEGVLIIAATNAPWDVDGAFRRPGRFERVLFVAPPDLPGRAAILRLMCQGKPTADIDFDRVAKTTERFSGADLKALVDKAVEVKLKEAMKSGKVVPLETQDLLAAAALNHPTTAEWFETGKNYAKYANQDGTYDEILNYLRMK